MNKIINKADMTKFMSLLSKDYIIYGPIKKENITTYDIINSYEDMVLDKISDYPPKKYLLPYEETLYKYSNNKIELNVKPKNQILIVKPCDANAINYLDDFYESSNTDTYYNAVRENTVIFAFNCTSSCENCFCSSLGTDIAKKYDLLFTDAGSRYIINIGSQKGLTLTQSRLFSDVLIENESKLTCKKQLPDTIKLTQQFSSDIWIKHSDKCLSCCACTLVCPTCTCFDVADSLDIDLKKGVRKRKVSSCQCTEFTRVAGNFVFRNERKDMFKNRYYCKLYYSKENFNKQSCVGCGRCISACPAKIDMIEVINEL